jgi:hypothetical protein
MAAAANGRLCHVEAQVPLTIRSLLTAFSAVLLPSASRLPIEHRDERRGRLALCALASLAGTVYLISPPAEISWTVPTTAIVPASGVASADASIPASGDAAAAAQSEVKAQAGPVVFEAVLPEDIAAIAVRSASPMDSSFLWYGDQLIPVRRNPPATDEALTGWHEVVDTQLRWMLPDSSASASASAALSAATQANQQLPSEPHGEHAENATTDGAMVAVEVSTGGAASRGKSNADGSSPWEYQVREPFTAPRQCALALLLITLFGAAWSRPMGVLRQLTLLLQWAPAAVLVLMSLAATGWCFGLSTGPVCWGRPIWVLVLERAEAALPGWIVLWAAAGKLAAWRLSRRTMSQPPTTTRPSPNTRPFTDDRSFPNHRGGDVEAAGLLTDLPVSTARSTSMGRSAARSAVFVCARALQPKLGALIFVGLIASQLIVTGLGAGVRRFPDATAYAAPFWSRWSWSDSNGYASGARELLVGGELNPWNQRRPINTCWLAVRLGVTGGHEFAAAAMEQLALAIPLAWLCRAVLIRQGPFTAMAVWGWIWGYHRWYGGTTLSEPLGLILGTAGLAAWWLTSPHRSVAWSVWGVGWQTLGQTARPGALFLLPFAGLGVMVLHRRQRITCLLAGMLGAGVCGGLMLSPSLLNGWYGTGENLPGSNFAYTLLGLAEGKSWSQVAADYREELAAQPDEGAAARFMYARAWEQIQRQPLVLVSELLRAGFQFLRGIRPVITQLTLGDVQIAGWLRFPTLLPIAWLGYACLTALWRWRHRADVQWLWWGWAGIATSVPIVFLDGGWRVLAATWPLMATTFALAFATWARPLTPLTSQPTLTPRSASTSAFASTAVWQRDGWGGVVLLLSLLTVAAGPAALHRLLYQHMGDRTEVWPPRIGEQVVIEPDPRWSRPNIAVHPVGDAAHNGLDVREFQRWLQRGGIERLGALRSATFVPGYWQTVFDRRSRQLVLVSSREPLLPASGPVKPITLQRCFDDHPHFQAWPAPSR